jgi:hypothetical protein
MAATGNDDGTADSAALKGKPLLLGSSVEAIVRPV